MRCPNCSTELPPNVSRCPQCGELVSLLSDWWPSH
ncbi:MAG: zinc-ribbon domain-containing protein, partial [Candidatus Saccharibacteria bacterium]